MKHLLLILLVSITLSSYGQKQNISLDVLSDVISKKQDELKLRVLSNIVVKNIRTTNYSTYNSIYNLVDIITTEKNKTVMTQSIVQQIADYSITYLLADYFIKKRLSPPGINYEQDFKRTGDNKGLIDLLKSKISEKVDQSQKIQEEKKAPLKISGLDPALLANFVVDTLRQMLGKEKFFTDKGFFKINNERPFFTTGLAIDYNAIRNSEEFKEVYMPQLINFINNVKAGTILGDDVFNFIKDANFEDFKKIDNNQINLLLVLFDRSLKNFRLEIGQNSFIATIGDIIKKYFIFDMNPNDEAKIYTFKIDVEAIILAFEERFQSTSITSIQRHLIGIKPFFNIGLNYGYFINPSSTFLLNDNTTKSISQIALAGEKLGLKVIFADYKYMRSNTPLEWYQYRGKYRRWLGPTKKPLISNFYGFAYVSGLLYNILNIKSEKNFDYAITGTGLGVEFYNGLEVNLSYVIPIIPKATFSDMNNRSFISLGFDIPIFEYLSALKDKRK